MTRFAITLGFAVAVAAWADAQNGPIAADRARQYQSNRALLTNLVDHTVDLANAGEPLAKAQACQKLMTDISVAMDQAVVAQNAGRVAELGDHLAAVVDTALVPSLKTAGRDITPTSLQYPALVEVHTRTQTDLARMSRAVPMDGSLARTAAVKDALAKLQSAEATLINALK